MRPTSSTALGIENHLLTFAWASCGWEGLHRCWWQVDVGDFMLVTEFRYWWHLLVTDVGNKIGQTVANISKLSSTYFVSNIRHQHRCSRWEAPGIIDCIFNGASYDMKKCRWQNLSSYRESPSIFPGTL